ncbi:MAG TPA: amidohydrolase family protein [Acidobacteriota bacterium]|nr:amidohydrolase family protein [Acidobacteriota bacterium]
MRRPAKCVLLALPAFVAHLFAADEASVRARIRAGVEDIRLIDTHEHLSPEDGRIKQEQSLFTLLHYVTSDMWADGMDRSSTERLLADPSAPLEKKWQAIAPYWNNVRTTAYGRNLLRAIRDLYGISDISESTYPDVCRKIRDSNQPGWYETVLKKKAGIDMAISDVGPAGAALNPDLFRAVIQLDHFLVFPEATRIVEPSQGVVINTLADWENALQKAFEQAKEKKFVAVKSPVAYQRSLDFAAVDRAEAEALFDRLKEKKGKTGRPDWSQNKPLQDYMFGKIADNCARYDLPLQIHTGFFYDTWRNVTQANPSHLIPFIMRHRNTRFVLMHGGYPYGGELLAMAKNLPNVTIDMCWTYIISPAFAARFLDEAIETVPSDKILGFGGDYQIPEGSYAHAMLCREVVSKVLADKVLSGYWSEAEALKYARALLRDNALRVFKLQ